MVKGHYSNNPFYNFNISQYIDEDSIRSSIILYGAENTGTLPHSHVAAYNFLLSGKKLWFICNKEDFDRELLEYFLENGTSEYSIFDFFNRAEVKEKTFIQSPGDIVFVEKDYIHAVLNLDDSVCYIAQVGGE